MIRYLGFFLEEVYMGKGAASVEACGPHTMWWRIGGTRAAMWCGGLVPFSVSSLGSVIVSGKIGPWVFVSSNSVNIFLITFLKQKTAENRKLALDILLIG